MSVIQAVSVCNIPFGISAGQSCPSPPDDPVIFVRHFPWQVISEEQDFAALLRSPVKGAMDDIRYFVATKIYGCDGFFAVATKRQEETA